MIVQLFSWLGFALVALIVLGMINGLQDLPENATAPVPATAEAEASPATSTLPATSPPVTAAKPAPPAPQPSTTAPVPPTVPLPKEGTPCQPRGAQTRGFACVRSNGGDIWFAAPFALPSDIINVLQVEPTEEVVAKVRDILVLPFALTDISPAGGLTYWCTTAVMSNSGTTTESIAPTDWAIINPSGVVELATVPALIDSSLLLLASELEPGGSVTGMVCFDVPIVPTGRMSVAYLPGSFSGPDRALYYFDR